jgi:hypothetical protein
MLSLVAKIIVHVVPGGTFCNIGSDRCMPVVLGSIFLGQVVTVGGCFRVHVSLTRTHTFHRFLHDFLECFAFLDHLEILEFPECLELPEFIEIHEFPVFLEILEFLEFPRFPNLHDYYYF